MESGPRRLKLRYPGVCHVCASKLAPGDFALYERATKLLTCLACVEAAESVDVQAVGIRPATSEPGVAGASARREFERRAANRRQRVQTQHPKIGGLILALTNAPQSTRAWQAGAVGEELLGEQLDSLGEHGVRVLHDRRVPRSRANIDHIAISSAGVFVLDAKRYRDKRPHLRVEGGILRSRVETMMVGRRKHDDLVLGLQRQVRCVQDIIAAEHPQIPVTGMLVFVDADWPVFGGDFTIQGVEVLWPKKAAERIRGRGEMQQAKVEMLFERIARVLPPA